MGWEVPCIARPARIQKAPSGILASVSEDIIRDAITDGGVAMDEDGEEPGGGWVEDLNGLLGFNKGFQGRYMDHE
jgi:hypothetical protein